MLIQNSLDPVFESYIPWSDSCAPKLAKYEESLNSGLDFIEIL